MRRVANGNGAHTKEAAKHVYKKLSQSDDIEATLKELAENMNKGIFF
ncbi:DUF3024 domain-containing protein [Capnocytophaga sp. oral taxon 878]|nr:DUF3024 domain-containing protein [Capnocytophaga sp. oral taxon 878]